MALPNIANFLSLLRGVKTTASTPLIGEFVWEKYWDIGCGILEQYNFFGDWNLLFKPMR